MTRTIDDIKLEWQKKRAKWEEAQPQHSLDEAMEWLGSYGVVWKLLDYINTLEAQVQALGKWESPNTIPPMFQSDDKRDISIPVECLAKICLYRTEIKGENGKVYWEGNIRNPRNGSILGWRYLKEQDENREASKAET